MNNPLDSDGQQHVISLAVTSQTCHVTVEKYILCMHISSKTRVADQWKTSPSCFLYAFTVVAEIWQCSDVCNLFISVMNINIWNTLVYSFSLLYWLVIYCNSVTLLYFPGGWLTRWSKWSTLNTFFGKVKQQITSLAFLFRNKNVYSFILAFLLTNIWPYNCYISPWICSVMITREQTGCWSEIHFHCRWQAFRMVPLTFSTILKAIFSNIQVECMIWCEC